MSRRSMIHPRLLGRLGNRFPLLCRIERQDEGRDGHGQKLESWTVVVGLEAVACRKAPGRGQKLHTETQTYTPAGYRLMLSGRYLDGEAHPEGSLRAVVDEVTYEIKRVSHDGEMLMTYLDVEVVR